jgi:uncharacterized membrane protein HdeD (DUF308 family)
MDESLEHGVASLAKYWWAIALRGVLAILFGILAAMMPGLTLYVLVLLFGAYALVEGVFNVVAAISRRRTETHWWALLLEGLVSILAGLIAFVVPGLTALWLVYLISAWAIITGVLEIAAAIRLRKTIEGEWWLALSGVLSLIFGLFIAIAPGAGAIGLVLWIGAYAIIFGISLIALAFRLRHASQGGAGTVVHAT